MSIIPYKGLSVTQRELLEAMDRRRRKDVATELKTSGLRSAIKCYNSLSHINYRLLGLTDFNPRSLLALEKAGFVEIDAKRTPRLLYHWTKYAAKITPAGQAYLARH